MSEMKLLRCAGVAVLLMYGWMPICWAIGKVMGWL